MSKGPHGRYVAAVNSKMPDELTDYDVDGRAEVLAKTMAELESGPLRACEDDQSRLDEATRFFGTEEGEEWSKWRIMTFSVSNIVANRT